MTIDKSGKWWIGSSPEDLREYLEAYSADGYKVDEFRLARCDCGSAEFALESSDPDGVARRQCTRCEKQHFICDSGEYWDEADTELWQCGECLSRSANIGVGFALYDDRSAIQWLYVGARCAQCGVLGCAADWKIAYEPSLQLMDQI